MSSTGSTPSWTERAGRRLGLLLLGLLAAAVLAELGARVGVPEQAWLESLVPQQVSDLGVHRLSEDPALLYELAPGVVLEQDGPYGPHRVTVNDQGFRGRAPAEGGFEVLALGGSNTYGPGVDDPQTWPARLEAALVASGRPDAQVLNLGVSGYMTRQKAALGERELARREPDLVLLQLYNTGRRFVLAGTVEQSFARWPQLYAEYLEGAHPGGLAWRSAAWRGLVLGWNRSRHEAIHRRLHARSVVEDREALEALLALAPCPVVVVLPVPGGQSELLRDLELPVIDLSALEQPFGPAGEAIHPGPEVYDWYGRRIAEGLEQLGLLPPPAPPSG